MACERCKGTGRIELPVPTGYGFTVCSCGGPHAVGPGQTVGRTSDVPLVDTAGNQSGPQPDDRGVSGEPVAPGRSSNPPWRPTPAELEAVYREGLELQQEMQQRVAKMRTGNASDPQSTGVVDGKVPTQTVNLLSVEKVRERMSSDERLIYIWDDVTHAIADHDADHCEHESYADCIDWVCELAAAARGRLK